MASNVEQSVVAVSAAAARVSKATIESAVNALSKYKAAHSTNEKLQLLPQDDYIYLNLTLKKIPSNPRTKPFRIPLSHPILDLSSQLCLIIDDRPQSPTPPSDQIKKLIKSQSIPISKVIKISKLKTNYKPFEAKRKLCDSYDLFLVDKRVVHLLPKLIGKEFFKKKKLPLGVDMGKKNLKSQVERALGSALLYLRTGTCCVMKVGKVAMEKDEIVENVFDAIVGAVEWVPKKWDGVRSLHLKFYDSVALPIYQAMPDVKLKIEGFKEMENQTELAKISDNEGEVKENSRMKDVKSGKKKKSKGRIHEVRYMDVGEDIESDYDDDVDESGQVGSEDKDDFEGNKGVEGILEESGDDDDDDDGDEGDMDQSNKIADEDLSVDESVGKKRSKSKARKALKEAVLGVLNGEKRVKKKAKSEKTEGGKKKAKAEKIEGGKKKEKLEKIEGGKPENDGLRVKGKKKSELGRKPSERIAKMKYAKNKK